MNNTVLKQVRKFNLPLVQRLIKMGCPTDQADVDGETPLWTAVLLDENEEHKEDAIPETKAGIMRALVVEGKASARLVDPANGTSPLITACGRGLKAAVEQLLELGCVDEQQLLFRNFPQCGQVSALEVALSKGHVSIARSLLEQHTKLSVPVPEPRKLLALFLVGLGAEDGGEKQDLVPLVEDMMKLLGVDDLSTPLICEPSKVLAHNLMADLMQNDQEDDTPDDSPMSELLKWLVKTHPPVQEGLDQAVEAVEKMDLK